MSIPLPLHPIPLGSVNLVMLPLQILCDNWLYWFYQKLTSFPLFVFLTFFFCHLFIFPGGNICRADEFLCNNSLCKLHFWVCDGEDDCGDNSDEVAEMCGMTLHFSEFFV